MSALSDSTPKQEQYYLTIDDLPLWNWMQISEGKKEFTRKNLTIGDTSMDEQAFILLYDDYLKFDASNEAQKRIIELVKKKAGYELDYVITDNAKFISLAANEEEKLNRIKERKSGEGMTIEQGLVYVSKWLGTLVTPQTIPLKMYLTVINEFKKSSE